MLSSLNDLHQCQIVFCAPCESENNPYVPINRFAWLGDSDEGSSTSRYVGLSIPDSYISHSYISPQPIIFKSKSVSSQVAFVSFCLGTTHEISSFQILSEGIFKVKVLFM